MKLIVAHQILIGAAIALAVLMGLRSAVLYARGAGSGELAMAAVAAVATVVLGIYLRSVRAKWLQQKG